MALVVDGRDLLLPAVSLAAASIYFGQTLYVSLAEGPTLAELPAERAAAMFPVHWPKAAAVIIPTAVASPLLMLASWHTTGDRTWAAGAALASLAIAYTAGVMKPTISDLRNPSAQTKDAVWKRDKLNKFYSMHTFRTVLAAGTVALGVLAISNRSAALRLT